MSDLQSVGNYFLRETRPDKVKAASTVAVASRIGVIVAQQVNVRGPEKPFEFKALGFRWRYIPEGAQGA